MFNTIQSHVNTILFMCNHRTRVKMKKFFIHSDQLFGCVTSYFKVLNKYVINREGDHR